MLILQASDLQDLGYPWVCRKVMLKYGSQSTDVIRQTGSTLRIASVNAKGSWCREMVEGREVSQRNALGESVKVKVAWEGAVHKATFTGASMGRHTTWRYMDAGLMVVRTAVALDKGRETCMFWYLEAIEEPDILPSSPNDARAHKKLAQHQKRVMRATAKDNDYLKRLARSLAKWETPADHFSAAAAHDGKESKDYYGSMFPRSSSPPSSTMSPASASPRAGSMAYHGHMPFAMHDGPASTAAPSCLSGTRAGSEAEDETASASDVMRSVRSGHNAVDGMPNGHADASSFQRPSGRPSSEVAMQSMGSGDSRLQGPAHGPQVTSTQRRINAASVDLHPDAASCQSAKTLEAVLSARLQEYSEARSITTVIPLDNPLASDEPELLAMSPEQAEDTQLKLAELEREMRKVTQQRAAHAAGRECCCCTVVFHRAVIPAAVRVWDL